MTQEPETLHKAENDVTQQIDANQQERLSDNLYRLGDRAKTNEDSATTEKTPLLKAGKDAVGINSDEDMAALDSDIRKDEEAAMTGDHKHRTSKIARDEALGIFGLAIPMVGSQAMGVIPAILMGWMLGNSAGYDSANVLAASSLANFVQGQLVNTPAGGIGSVLSTVCTQSFGAKQMRQFCLYGQAGMIAIAYCVAIMSLVTLNGATVFKLLGQDAELADLAGVFTTIVTFSTPFIFLYDLAHYLLSSQQRVAPLVYVPILANLISLPLAYVLGFHSRLSYIGVALAGVVNSILKVAIVIPMLLRTPAFVEGWPGWHWKEAHAIMTSLLPLGFSSILMVMSQNVGLSLTTIMCGYLPDAARAIAADNVASSLFSIAIVPLIGVGLSGGIRVGTAIGAGKQRHAIVSSYVAIGITTGVAFLSAITTSIFAGSFSDGYTTDTPTADLATAVYPAQATLVVLLGWMIGIQSVLRACGKQVVIAKLNFLFLFVVSIPLGLVLAIPLKLGLIGLYLGSVAGTIGLNVACSVYVYRFDWAEVVLEAYVNSHLDVEKEPESEPSV